MSQKYIAIIDNIFYNSRIYGLGETIIVEDKVAMEPAHWQKYDEYIKAQEEAAAAASRFSVADSEKDELIEKLKKDNAEKEKTIKALKKEIEELKK